MVHSYAALRSAMPGYVPGGSCRLSTQTACDHSHRLQVPSSHATAITCRQAGRHDSHHTLLLRMQMQASGLRTTRMNSVAANQHKTQGGCISTALLACPLLKSKSRTASVRACLPFLQNKHSWVSKSMITRHDLPAVLSLQSARAFTFQ